MGLTDGVVGEGARAVEEQHVGRPVYRIVRSRPRLDDATKASAINTLERRQLPPIPIPKPSYLDQCVSFGARDGEKRWKSRDGSKLYTWDWTHGDIEVFNKRGRHLGSVNAISGELIKDPVPGRKIDV